MSITPDILALELDKERFFALKSKTKTNIFSLEIYRKLGFKPFLFNLIGSYIEKKLSKSTGILPGTEMKTAINLAKKNNIQVALIDQPIQITLKKLTSQLTRKEKLSLLKDILFSLFSKKQAEFDLNEVPSEKIIAKLITQTKEKYPTVYRILVKERNEYMAKALYKIINLDKDKKILAVIGAGHEKEVIRIIRSYSNN